MIEVQKIKFKKEKAVLVALTNRAQPKEKTEEYLDELDFLASTINIKCVERFTQHMDKPDKRTFIGKGKLEEIRTFVEAEADIDAIIFDDELSPSQVRNLENEYKLKIYDRSLLILDIFLFRAKTAQAKAQVELARAQYLLPRLTRMWTHLERQRGGTSTRGGAGEKEIETDRRVIRQKITRLKKQLEKIDKQSITQRKGRDKLVRVALVGYTNVGKSTLMRLLSKSDVFAEDKLFATVDSTVRKVVLSNIPFLLTDTVGFIRKLPHSLIECFKSTLDEVREADILVHVVDISSPAFREHMDIVKDTLWEIGADDKKVITVYNKVDKLREEEGGQDMIDDFISGFNSSEDKDFVMISAAKKENTTALRKLLFKHISKVHYTIFPNFLKTEFYG